MLAETMKTGLKTKMIRPQDLKRVNMDTTVQEKEIRFPTDARLYHRFMEVLVRLAKRKGLRLRQTYARVAKKSMLKLGGYAKAKQFNRAKRETKFLRTRLGRVLRDFHGKAPAEILQECQVLLDRTSASTTSSGMTSARSIPCMRRRWNASPRGRFTNNTSMG